jgi:hypothetical protein
MPINATVRGSFGPQGKFGAIPVAASAGAPLTFLSTDYVQEFSVGYFGVETEDSYILPNNASLNSVTFKKQQSGFYHFWFLVATKSGTTTSDNTYTFKYGALLPVPAGGSAGDVVTVNLSTALTSFGSSIIPSTGTHYIAWHSGSASYPGATNPSGGLWWGENYLTSMGSYRGRGGMSWMNSETAPTLNSTFVGGTGAGFNYHAFGIAIKANYTLFTTTTTLNGSTPINAATSARAIKELTGTTTSGYYWIKPTSYDVPRLVYCDMSTSGGGWMLIGWHGGNSAGANSHVSNNEWNSSFTLGSGAYSSASLLTPVPKNNDSYGLGYRFIKSLVTSNRSTGSFAATWSNDAGSQIQSMYFFTDSNADWDKYDTRAASNPSFSNTDSRYAWLRTGYSGYSTSGRGGGGSSTGDTITYNGADWGVVPFNMQTGTGARNRGIAITGYYSGGTAASPNYITQYFGGHSDDIGAWGRPIGLWLKV